MFTEDDDFDLPGLLGALPPKVRDQLIKKVLVCKNCNHDTAHSVTAMLTLLASSLDKVRPGAVLTAKMVYGNSSFAVGYGEGIDFTKAFLARTGLEILDEIEKIRKEDKANAHIQGEQDNLST